MTSVALQCHEFLSQAFDLSYPRNLDKEAFLYQLIFFGASDKKIFKQAAAVF